LDEIEFQKLKNRLGINESLPIWNRTEKKVKTQLIY